MMTYVFCLIYVALIYVRPGEIVPQWAGLPIVQVTGVVAAVSAAVSLFLEPRRFANLPNDWCFLGFCLAGILSTPANGWLGGGYVVFVEFLPLLGFYLLIRLAVRTEMQLRWFIAVLIVLTLFQATNGMVQYWTGVGIGGSTAVVEGSGAQAPELQDRSDIEVVRRIRGTGIFGDPNDLAMSLVVVFPFLFSAILSRDPGLVRRVLGLGALAVVSYALFLTQSRGGLVGLAALGAAYSYRRFGRVTAVIVALAVVGVLLTARSSRLQEMTSSEESAQGRIQAWSAGLEMLKSKPVLGVGVGAFTEHHERVAHNSFVHTFAEVGFVGGFFFVGMFFWFFVGNGAARDVAGAAGSTLARDLWASCIGIIVCACFLSRQYSPVLYLPLVMGAVRMSVEQKGDHQEPFQRRWDWLVLLILSCGVVVAAYVAVRVLAVWSRA